MGYRLGIDLGTTWTAAAVARDDGTVETVALGGRSAAVPTVVHIAPDGTVTVGEAAARRGATEPDRLAREMKRRVGDTVPLILGGVPYAPEALLGEVAAWVVATVRAVEGGPPDAVRVSHPANWGPLRRELLEGALRQRGVGPLTLVTEPEAAALHYASAERVPVGTTLAVYDLGGGTFDATVLRKHDDAFEVLGAPEGIDRLGGLDFDAAVFAHVTAALGPAWADLDPDDPAVQAGVARLRESCVVAKEALSSDADAVVAVTIPGLVTDVRITRAELEQMIRPAIATSVDALRRAVDGAGLGLAQVDRILLVGGSSRIPLVTELVGALGPPVVGDAHPKHAVALGAARGAARTVAVAAPAAPMTAPVEAIEPSPRGRSRVPAVAAAIAAVLVLGVAAVLATGGGGDDDDASEEVDTSDDPGTDASTSTTDPALELEIEDLAGSYVLDLADPTCTPSDAVCPTGFAITASVQCTEVSGCFVEFPQSGERSETATDEADGSFLFTGSANSLGLIPCFDPEVPAVVGWELVLTPASMATDGTVDELAGSMVLEAESGCAVTTAAYDLTGRPGEVGDEVEILVGDWTLVDELPSCSGSGCSGLGSLTMPVTITCAGATCTASLAGSDPAALTLGDAIAEDGLLLNAFGELPPGEGLTCGVDDSPTSFGLTVHPALDAQGRLVTDLTLSTDPDGPCGDTIVTAAPLGIPA